MIVSNLLHAAARIAGVLMEPGRGMSDSGLQEALYVLNALIDSWGTERLLVFAELRSVFPVAPGKQQYTIGLPSTTGTWDTTTTSWDQQTQTWDQTGYTPDWVLPRPTKIERASYLYLSSDPPVENRMDVLNDQQWQATSPKSLTSAIPYQIYYQPFVPLGVANLWPVPDGTDEISIVLYTWQVIQQFASTDATVILPPAYQEALEYNLAVKLAMRYPKRAKLNPLAVAMAQEAKQRVKISNNIVWLMRCESGAGTGTRGAHWSSISGHYLPGGPDV